MNDTHTQNQSDIKLVHFEMMHGKENPTLVGIIVTMMNCFLIINTH